jgi:hypothetical protein
MTNPDKLPPDLEALFNEFLDDTISDDAIGKLSALLDESRSARSFFLQFCQLLLELITEAEVAKLSDSALNSFRPRQNCISHAAMPVVAAEEPSSEHPLVAKNPGASLGSSFRIPAIAFVLGILVAVGGSQLWPTALRDRGNIDGGDRSRDFVAKDVDRVGPRVTPVAYLASSNGCSWGAGSPQVPTVGSSVRLGDEITLYEGIAEFRLASGVALSVEGPAALVMTSATSAVLQHGKVTVHVPWTAPEFRMVSGECRLEARDAEFGVDLTRTRLEVHAFSGSVSVAQSPFESGFTASKGSADDVDDVHDFVPLTVEPGTAIALVRDLNGLKPPVKAAADHKRFATNLSMGGNLPVGRPYVDAVLAAQPVGYWRFESVDGGIARNEIAGGMSLKVIGDVPLSGGGANHVAEFGRPPGSGRLLSDRPIEELSGAEDYSFETWVKPSHFHRGVVLALTTGPQGSETEEPDLFGFRLELQRGFTANGRGRPGSIRFLHRNPPTPGGGTSCYSNRLYELRHWQHVVTVKQGAAMHVYLDGKKVATAADATPMARGFYLMVGQCVSEAKFCYVGQLDELAVYRRALSAEEIAKHYKLVQPGPRQTPDI